MNWFQILVAFLGRALLSIIFIASGVHKILDWQGSQNHFIQGLNDWLALSIGNSVFQNLIEFGLSHVHSLFLLSVCFEIVGGLLIFFGLWLRLGALLLIIFLVPMTFVFHHFWQIEGPDRDLQAVEFMKNVGILGGLLILLALGKGSKCVKSHDLED
jgi:putative oxidoreductase